MKKLLWSLALLLIFACNPRQNRQNSQSKLFEIHKKGNDYQLIIKNSNQTFTYYFSTKPKPGQIKIPVRKIAITSTTHLGFISALGKEQTVCAISGKNFVYNNYIRQHSSQIDELGFDKNLNYEKLLINPPQILLVYNLQDLPKVKLQMLEKAGIAVIPIFEYLEDDPISRLEWIKVFGLIYNQLDVATAYYDSVKTRYLTLKQEVKSYSTKLNKKPKILVNIPYRGIWYIPSGNSYMAKFITDAQGLYPWENTKAKLSLPLSLEQVMDKAQDADIMINTGLASSIKDILAIDPRLKFFKAIKNRQVYNNNKLHTKDGGTAFWEIGVVQPDRILADLIRIFYPKNNFTPDTLTFYQKLN